MDLLSLDMGTDDHWETVPGFSFSHLLKGCALSFSGSFLPLPTRKTSALAFWAL